MTDANANPFLDTEGEPTGDDQSGSALRKWGKAEKARADALAEKVKQLEADLAKRAATEVFTKLGISDKIRKYYSGEPTEEAITAWWKEAAPDFGVEPGAEDVTLTEEQRQTHADITQAQQLGGTGRERPDALGREALAETRKGLLSNRNATEADFDEALRKMNVPDMPLMAPQF